MSSWTYITGTIVVSPLGRTQPEKRYILESVLDHLPRVTGSEDDMHIHIVQKTGYDQSSNCDEFGESTNNLVRRYGYESDRGLLNTQSEYILVVEAALRDRVFEETFRDFQKWLCRLAKRVSVDDILVKVSGYERSYILTNDRIDKRWTSRYGQLFEAPSWSRVNETSEPNWCEYLMWQAADNADYPAVLAYKYFDDAHNNGKVERWLGINSKESESE